MNDDDGRQDVRAHTHAPKSSFTTLGAAAPGRKDPTPYQRPPSMTIYSLDEYAFATPTNRSYEFEVGSDNEQGTVRITDTEISATVGKSQEVVQKWIEIADVAAKNLAQSYEMRKEAEARARNKRDRREQKAHYLRMVAEIDAEQAEEDSTFSAFEVEVEEQYKELQAGAPIPGLQLIRLRSDTLQSTRDYLAATASWNAPSRRPSGHSRSEELEV